MVLALTLTAIFINSRRFFLFTMGRIKTMLTKRVTNQLVKEHASDFKTNFEENKKIVERFADIPSKKLRNTIAGYVTRQIKRSQN